MVIYARPAGDHVKGDENITEPLGKSHIVMQRKICSRDMTLVMVKTRKPGGDPGAINAWSLNLH